MCQEKRWARISSSLFSPSNHSSIPAAVPNYSKSCAIMLLSPLHVNFPALPFLLPLLIFRGQGKERLLEDAVSRRKIEQLFLLQICPAGITLFGYPGSLPWCSK